MASTFFVLFSLARVKFCEFLTTVCSKLVPPKAIRLRNLMIFLSWPPFEGSNASLLHSVNPF